MSFTSIATAVSLVAIPAVSRSRFSARITVLGTSSHT
jgi:hypothetical protein